MHQHRRRKKRPSYGVRTVEISRGKNGFGFTISGQAPCILSCIITGSPAEKAGLRPGDFLIAVNGQNVSKAPHDDVVRLIGCSSDILKLQIAENYYSDSSEEEFVSVVKLRPKYPNKIRNRQQNSVSRAEKVVQDLQTGALFVDHIHGNVNVVPKPKTQTANHAGPSRSNKVLLDLILQQRLQEASRHSPQSFISKPLNVASASEKSKQKCLKKKESKALKSRSDPEHLNTSSSSTSEVFHSIFTEQDLNNILYPAIYASQNNNELKDTQEQAILNAVVGYLGTIEMPKEPQFPNSRLQTIRNCIRRLRVEKKVHTLVLMSVFTDCIILINPQGITLAEFSADKITFSGVYSDDKKFFGLVTNHGVNNEDFCANNQDEPSTLSSSCHVFMVDPKLTPHHQHIKRAKAFHITCTSDPITNKCKEFPESADSILQAVVGLYRNKLDFNNDILHGLEFHVNMSPQPSNTSSNSSNSDSGIGFRDEGNASDRVFVVDVDNYHQYSTNSLDRQAFSIPGLGLLESPLRSFSLSQDSPLLPQKSVNHAQSHEMRMKNNISPSCQFDRLTVRAMPDPVGFERNCSADNLDQNKLPVSQNSLHNLMQFKQDAPICSKNNKSATRVGSCTIDSLNEDLYDSTKNSALIESSPNKLSPKVYGFNYSLKCGDEMGFCNTSADSVGWECTSCSTEELQVQSRHLMFHETQDTTEQEEDGSQDVHPPTQEEDSEAEILGIEHNESSRKWGRTSSLRRHLGRKRNPLRSTHDAGTVSDGEIASGKVSTSSSMLALDRLSDTSHRSSCASERPIDVGRVGSWAAGFNVLLEDPAGLHTFSEFLKKEFSQENITFWIACERYRQLKDESLMSEMAKDIYNKHLCIGAQEPVNVDSHARQVAQEGLNAPTPDLFLPAQKQIFNLMKFDCYQRFLKSTMFKECMLREMQGQPLLYQGQLCDDSVFSNEKPKSGLELKKRKSLIPWHKLSKAKSNESKTNGSRLWDRHSEIRKSLKKKKKDKNSHKIDDTSSTQSDLTDRSSVTSSEPGVGLMYKNVSSRESLNSAELTLFPSHRTNDSHYCRVILPDLSTTVVRTQAGETVGEMLLKLLERRSLTYNAVEAYIVGSHQPLDHCTDVTSLSCREIRVEQVILFCVELPNKKTIGVKAKNNKICGDILKPVLNKYGYKMDHVKMTVASLQKAVVISAPITTIDNQRVIIEMKEPFSNICDLEELTNQIFDDLLKTRPEFQYDGLGSIDQEKSKENDKSTYKSTFSHVTQQDIDSSQCSSKIEGVKLPNENKPLLPHNPSRIKNVKESCFSCLENLAANANLDVVSMDLSHGKENCPMLNKKRLKSNAPFNGRDLDYGSTTVFQSSDTNLAQEMLYSSTQISENCFSRPYYSLNSFDEVNSEKFLQNLGIIPSSLNDKLRNSQWPNIKCNLLHTPPKLPPRIRTELKDPALLNTSSSPNGNLDSTLIASDSFDLNLEADVTLHALSDESLSPLRGFSSENPQIDEPLVKRDLMKETSFTQPPLRRLSYEPPPVPPKASARGPPPRPPSRQLVHGSGAFCLTSDDEGSGNDDRHDNFIKVDNSLQKKNSYLDLDKDYSEFNISFV